MKQRVTDLIPEDRPVSDLDALFLAVYNLIYEKIQLEPNKGIVVSKGKPNQRKVPWTTVMKTAHELEDYFRLREQNTNGRICEECSSWSSQSKASPYLGLCSRKGDSYVHGLSSCKKFCQRENNNE